MNERSMELETKLSTSLDEIIQENNKKQRSYSGRYPKENNKRSSPYDYNLRNSSKPIITNRVYVGNLAYRTTWQSLKDHFKSCGNVLFADIFMEGGRSKGCG
jgi:RNA recognition motif-containing protein